MAGDTTQDPLKSLEFKEKGNKRFQARDYVEAEALYSKAISYDPSNPLLYTNRAMSYVNFQPPAYELAIADSQQSIRLLPQNMKAFYVLAQGQIELQLEAEALESAKEAHRLCVELCQQVPMGKGSSSITKITELVLRCKKELWERRETERLATLPGLLYDLVSRLESTDMADKIPALQQVFEDAGAQIRRKVPDWCVDHITFDVMLDPVITKKGKSYDRSSLIEHLKRSQTDPMTREPLTIEDLRPNLMLRDACEEFLKNNGWAVEY